MLEYNPFGELKTGGPGKLSVSERTHLRDLAERVRQISNEPRYSEKIGLWKCHNSLKRIRPMVLTYPEGAWGEMIPIETMTIEDPFWRSYEWILEQMLYRGQRIFDDNIIDGVIEIALKTTNTGYNIPIKVESTGVKGGANHFVPGIVDLADVDRMIQPEWIINLESTNRELSAVKDVIGDILEVKVNRKYTVDTSLINMLVYMRGMDNLMIDMIENPEWLHGVLGFMQASILRLMDQIDGKVEMTLNNGNDYTGTGGLGYVDELPKTKGGENNFSFSDLWGTAESQHFDMISPAMYEEFAVQYQIPILKRYGLVSYGCCESLNKKFEIVKKIPNLRRVSVSPWTDVSIAANALEDRYILSWKPNPSKIVSGCGISEMRKDVSDTLTAAKGCVIEMILKDTHTIYNKPETIEEWVNTANELAQMGY
ncbi:MAG: hypothetical protein WCI88_04575 [Chloroflexota bacterium]